MKCNKCQQIFRYYDTYEKGQHLMGYCPACGAFQKNIPQEEPRLYFGKYKGQEIKEVLKKDEQYLDWLSQQDWVKPNLKRKIYDAKTKTDQSPQEQQNQESVSDKKENRKEGN